jgi:ankyrin repeat protein
VKRNFAPYHLQSSACPITVQHGHTALGAAAYSGSVELTKRIIQAGADVNCQHKTASCCPFVHSFRDLTGVEGNGRLAVSIQLGLFNVNFVWFSMLLSKRGVNSHMYAHTNTRMRDLQLLTTPLHTAAWRGHAETVKVLLKAGADPELLDYVRIPNFLPAFCRCCHLQQAGYIFTQAL